MTNQAIPQSCKEKTTLADGNATAQACVNIILSCKSHNVPVALENPRDSLLFLHPAVQAAAKGLPQLSPLEGCCLEAPPVNVDVSFDMCAFGAPWRKPTRLWFWNLSEADVTSLSSMKCRSHRSLTKGAPAICGFSQRPHQQLTGAAKSSFRTKVAEAYPIPFAEHLARILLRVQR